MRNLLLLFIYALGSPPGSLASSIGIKDDNPCQCAIYTKHELYRPGPPDTMVLSVDNNLEVDCADYGKATAMCKQYCAKEMNALIALIQKDPAILTDFPPSGSIEGCSENIRLRYSTLSFAKVCGSDNEVLSSRAEGPSVCCSGVGNALQWCSPMVNSGSSLPDIDDNTLQSRKLDLNKAEDDEFQNEIEGSTKPAKKKPGKISPGSKEPSKVSSAVSTSSWIRNIMKQYFGYSSIGDIIRGINIFELPNKVQGMFTTYKDEVRMGRCYMEFSTFKIFTRQENPFEDLLKRRRREAPQDPDTLTIEELGQGMVEHVLSNTQEYEATPRIMNSIMGFADSITTMMEQSEATRPYSGLIKTILPVVTSALSGSGGGSGGAGGSGTLPMLLSLVGPMLSQIGPKPTQTSKYPEKNSPPVAQASTNPLDSPLAAMAMKVIGSAFSNMLSQPGPPAAAEKIESSPVEYKPVPTPRPRPTPIASLNSNGGLGSLMNLFLNGIGSMSRPTNPPKRVTKPARKKPIKKKRPQIPANFETSVEVNSIEENPEDKADRDFIKMVMELIRPIFISIVGNAPGSSGVDAIRRASSLSTLGRVDDTLHEEVGSPYFCLKRYAINKAWSITENGVKTVVSKFSPEERERMKRMLD